MLHPNEIKLVKQGETGVVIPTKDYRICLVEAENLSPNHTAALREQLNNQISNLSVN